MFKYQLNHDTELRLLEPRYAEELYSLVDCNREHLGRWLPWVPACRGVEDRREFLVHCMQECAEQGNFVAGIWHGGTFAGLAGVNKVHGRDRTTSLFYLLGGAFQGKGLVTQACRAIISHAFSTLQAHRIEIFAVTENTRSRRVAERLGFRHEGTRREAYRLGEVFADLEVYALLAPDWAPRQAISFAQPLTDEAELRLLLPHYAEELFALTDKNRARLRPTMQWIDATVSVEDSRAFIRQALQCMAEETEVHWSIWYRGRLAGTIGTLPIKRHSRRAEFGYWVGEEFEGKGLITAAGHAMLAHLFTVLDLNRAELSIRTTNTRSRAVAERLGFTLEGIQRQAAWTDDMPVDMACYGLLREEWKSNSKGEEGRVKGEKRCFKILFTLPLLRCAPSPPTPLPEERGA